MMSYTSANKYENADNTYLLTRYSMNVSFVDYASTMDHIEGNYLVNLGRRKRLDWLMGIHRME